MDVRLPDATFENRAESPLYGELYPITKPAYPISNNPIYAVYIKYINHMSNTATWAHKQYSIYIPTMNPTIYPIVTRVQMFYSYTTYIKMKSILIHVYNVTPKPQPGFLLKQPHVRTVSSHLPIPVKRGSHDGVS